MGLKRVQRSTRQTREREKGKKGIIELKRLISYMSFNLCPKAWARHLSYKLNSCGSSYGFWQRSTNILPIPRYWLGKKLLLPLYPYFPNKINYLKALIVQIWQRQVRMHLSNVNFNFIRLEFRQALTEIVCKTLLCIEIYLQWCRPGLNTTRQMKQMVINK